MSSVTDNHRVRRLVLVLALAAGALVFASAPVGAGATARGGGVGLPGGGSGSAGVFAGQGMWIWYVSASNNGNVKSIIRKAHNHGIRTLFIKSADATNTWSQFTPSLVKRLHRAHLRVCGWQFVYGTHPVGEAVAGAHAERAGADCMVIDAESSYEGRYASATTYMKQLRARVGRRYPLALASFPYVDYHPALPYSVFLGPGGAQQNIPQLYWRAIGTTVPAGFAHTFEFNRLYGAPMEPLGQTYNNPPPREVKLFRRYAKSYGMTGLSWWDWQSTGPSSWKTLAAKGLKPAKGVKLGGLYPTLGRKHQGDLVVWAQEHLNGAGLHVDVTGKLNIDTSHALVRFQRRHGLTRSGILDPATWRRLMKVTPKPVNWARGRKGKSATPRAPASASLPAVRDEIPGMFGTAAR
jgi:peptidoglycan hydrolase-like protein with peptidoglycan-binding domain